MATLVGVQRWVGGLLRAQGPQRLSNPALLCNVLLPLTEGTRKPEMKWPWSTGQSIGQGRGRPSSQESLTAGQ